eukprot:scaffold16967_cov18-Tisochrysis_lutea.AAC.3
MGVARQWIQVHDACNKLAMDASFSHLSQKSEFRRVDCKQIATDANVQQIQVRTAPKKHVQLD